MHTEQKVWSNWSLGRQNYVNYPTFTEYFVITWLFSAHILLWGLGPLFVGPPVRPNMLNMPKSASVAMCQELWPTRSPGGAKILKGVNEFVTLFSSVVWMSAIKFDKMTGIGAWRVIYDFSELWSIFFGSKNYFFLTADISHTSCWSATKFGSVTGLANRD